MIEFYLLSCLEAYLLFLLITWPYLLFLKEPPMTLMEAVEKRPGKRVKIKAMWQGIYPDSKWGMIEMSLPVNASGAIWAAKRDGRIYTGEPVFISGRIMDDTLTKVRILTCADRDVIRKYLNRRIQVCSWFAFGGNLVWKLLQIYVF